MRTEQNAAVSLHNPKTWTPSVLQLLDATACALMAVCQVVRTRTAASGSPILRANADRDASAWQAAMEKRGADLLRGRIERMRPNKRPHYSPQARFEIVQYMRLRHWSVKQTAAYFAVHPNRIRAWVKEMRRDGEASRLFKPPVNKISDAVRWLVHQLRELCPEREFGTRSIAMQIVRAGKQLSRSTAQRILREQNPLPPSAPAKADDPSAPNTPKPHHILRPTTINRTWHMDLATLDFLFIRFYVAAIVDGFSRKLLALKVYKDAPAARNMLALVKNCMKTFGTPRFLVTDGGTQFKAKFKRGVKPLGIALVKGRDAKRFNGRVERFFKTFRLWQRLSLFAWKKDWIQRKLDIFRHWYNDRPMFLHDGCTPEEVWSGIEMPQPERALMRDQVQPVFAVSRVHFKGDCHLPKLSIEIIGSVKRIA